MPLRSGPDAACCARRVTRFCPQCGGGVEPTFRFCPACGDRLPAPPPPRDAAGPPPPHAPSPAAAAGGERSAAVPVLSPPAARTPPRPPCLAARRASPSPRKARPGPAEPLPEGEELRDRGAGRWRLRRLLEQGGGCGLLYEGAGPRGAGGWGARYPGASGPQTLALSASRCCASRRKVAWLRCCCPAGRASPCHASVRGRQERDWEPECMPERL